MALSYFMLGLHFVPLSRFWCIMSLLWSIIRNADVMYKMKRAQDSASHASFQVSVCLPHYFTFKMWSMCSTDLHVGSLEKTTYLCSVKMYYSLSLGNANRVRQYHLSHHLTQKKFPERTLVKSFQSKYFFISYN